jgi:hypothetical protein
MAYDTLGQIDRGPRCEYSILIDREEERKLAAGEWIRFTPYYLVRDISMFLGLTKEQQSGQQIKRCVSNTLYLSNDRKIQFYDWSGNGFAKELKTLLKEEANDPELRRLVALCEGADFADDDKVVNHHVNRITEWKELDSCRGGLGFLGYPGYSASWFRTEGPRLGGGTDVDLWIQTVHSYMEGYSVEHHLITPELFALVHDPEIEAKFPPLRTPAREDNHVATDTRSD